MLLKDKLYNYIVRGNENVKYEYERYVIEHIENHKRYRVRHWIILMRLNYHYRICKNTSRLIYKDEPMQKENDTVKSLQLQKNTMEVSNKRIETTNKNINKPFNYPYPEISKPETSCYNQIPPHQFVKRLLQYDTISFDVFDTLILRSISEMKSVYTLIGDRLDYLSFQRIRQRAQREAREKNIQKYNSNEMTLEDIYEVIYRKTDIPLQVGLNAEMEVEKEICYANPYMKRVFDILQSYGKRIIIVSDMYMSKQQIKEILDKAGYYNISEIYVSSEYKCSKAKGDLYNVVLEAEGIKNKMIHVGDNPTSDIKNARAKGIDAMQYTNVNTAGNKYRCDGQSQLIRAAYRGIVNNHFHCGMYKHSIPFEYGYAYGGLYVLGFMSWINRYVQIHNIDKVLFLARDGSVYKKVFSMINSTTSTEYMYWSRQANMKYAARYQKEQYLLRNINHKLNKGISIGSVLSAAKIEFIAKYFTELGIDLNEKLTDKNAFIVEQIICNNWNEILQSYEKERNIAKNYILNLIGESQRIAIVEVGWVGTSQEGLKKFIENEINPNCKVFCLSASSASSESADNLAQVMSNYYDSYLFSYVHNVSLAQFHRDKTGSKRTILLELFSQACHPSFKGFGISENNEIMMEFDIAEVENYSIIKEIEHGQLEFCKEYVDKFNVFPILLNISGYDAYMPFRAVSRKFDYEKYNLGDITIAETVGVNEGEMNRLSNIL